MHNNNDGSNSSSSSIKKKNRGRNRKKNDAWLDQTKFDFQLSAFANASLNSYRSYNCKKKKALSFA